MHGSLRSPDHQASTDSRRRRWLRSVGELLMPPACAVCRAPHAGGGDRDLVCGVCLARIVPLADPQCVRCGQPRLSLLTPLPAGATSPLGAPDALPPCRWCAKLPPYVRTVRSACRMDVGTGGALVHALKYDGWRNVALPMARRMARLTLPTDVVRERIALIPVPLASVRERERGYNQAEQLAVALAEEWRLPVWRDVLTRVRNTRSQVQLTPSERAGNVSQAFTVPLGARTRLRGAHLVLVDDVITTAATLNACAEALVESGTRIVSYITFGRAPEPGDRTDIDIDFDQD